MIVIEGLVKTFRDIRRGTVTAVDGVSFICQPGEVVGLLGANGAGKTTTMRILSTVLKPTAGLAEVAGFNVAKYPHEVRRRLGFLSASTGLYDRMSAWEHVKYFAELYGIAGDALSSRMDRVFADLRMDDFRDKLVGKLSTGMRQKVSIARALVHDPPVIIFDEPTLGLDVLVARSVLEQIERLRAAGKCILYSTHIMREVERLCSRVAIIHRGKLLALGRIEDLNEQESARDLEATFFNLVDRADSSSGNQPRIA